MVQHTSAGSRGGNRPSNKLSSILWFRAIFLLLFVEIFIATNLQVTLPYISAHIERRTIDVNVKQQCSEFHHASYVWKQYDGSAICNSSYSHEEHKSNGNFAAWIYDLFKSHYQVRHLRPSLMTPPDPEAVLRLVRVISDRIEYLKVPTLARRHTRPPLNILVIGGSVTAGMGCGENPVGLPYNSHKWNEKQLDCAWPARLEKLFNNVMFGGLDVVKVTNLATGGASSEIGRFVMEYRLFPDIIKEHMPHIVIWAHAANDSQEPDKEMVRWEHLPGFVQAARNLRACDRDLPLVVMLDEFYALDNYAQAMEVSGFVYEIASWYQLMSVSHFNVVRHKLYAHADNNTWVGGINGNKWNLHGGMGLHIGVAWVLFYNFLRVFVESCEDIAFLHSVDRRDSGGNALHVKYLGSSQRDENVLSLRDRWRRNMVQTEEMCSSKNTPSNKTEVCTYAWMVSPMTGISRPQDVNDCLRNVMTTNDGWEAAGYPVRQPRTGFYARKTNATFTLSVNVTVETKYITFVTMKSHREGSMGTQLRVNVAISRSVVNNKKLPDNEVYEISGYHQKATSIHVPHKFQLPGGGLKVGDVIEVTAKLVSGAYFKINGIAMCIY